MQEMNQTSHYRQQLPEDGKVIKQTLFERVAHVILLQPVLRNDLLTLQCMRDSCTLFRDEIAPIVSRKVETLNLSITPLMNGMKQYQFSQAKSIKYKTEKSIHTAFQKIERVGWHYPVCGNTTVCWDSGELVDMDEGCGSYRINANVATYAYAGNLLRINWHPSEPDSLYIKNTSSVPMSLIHISPDASVGRASDSQGGVTVEYQVIENTRTNVVNAREEQCVRYKGKLKITRVKVDYNALVREHTRETLRGIYLNQKNAGVMCKKFAKGEEGYHELIEMLASNGWMK